MDVGDGHLGQLNGVRPRGELRDAAEVERRAPQRVERGVNLPRVPRYGGVQVAQDVGPGPFELEAGFPQRGVLGQVPDALVAAPLEPARLVLVGARVVCEGRGHVVREKLQDVELLWAAGVAEDFPAYTAMVFAFVDRECESAHVVLTRGYAALINPMLT